MKHPWLILLLFFTNRSQQSNFQGNSDNNQSFCFSFFDCFICCRHVDEVSEPSSYSFENNVNTSNIIKSSNDEEDKTTLERDEESRNNSQIITDDPQNNRDNAFVNLCGDVQVSVSEFLDSKSSLRLRFACKSLLSQFHSRNNKKVLSSLPPNIQGGLECLEESGVMSFYLNRLSSPVSNLFKMSTFKTETDFPSFLESALNYYFQNNDLKSFWELVEVLIKSKHLDYDDLTNNFQIQVDQMVTNAFNFNLFCLMKTILAHNYLNPTTLSEGCAICVLNDFYPLFNLLTAELAKVSFNTISRNISDLLVAAVESGKLEFIKLLFDRFPISPHLNSIALSKAIVLNNVKVAQVLFDHELDYSHSSESVLNFIELAAKHNSFGLIDMLVNNKDGVKYFLCTTALKVAAYYNSIESLSKILQIITKEGTVTLDRIYSKSALSYALRDCLKGNSIIGLDKILENINTNCSVEDFKCYYEEIEEGVHVVFYCNIIEYSIRTNHEDGFLILLTHFGTESLKIVNQFCENSFLLAVKYGNLSLINRIAELCPELKESTDSSGNNALHIAMTKRHPIDFIMILEESFKLNWTAMNNVNISPFDLLRTNYENGRDEHF